MRSPELFRPRAFDVLHCCCFFCGFVCCSVQEFMTFTSALIVERTATGSRASVKEQGEGGKGRDVHEFQHGLLPYHPVA